MRKSIALLLLALLAVAGNAQASSTFTASSAGSHAATTSTQASAAVNFRIVIRESLVLGGEQQPARADAPPLVRMVSHEDGREVVTFARP